MNNEHAINLLTGYSIDSAHIFIQFFAKIKEVWKIVKDTQIRIKKRRFLPKN